MLWAIYAIDVPNSAPLRAKVVDQHVQYFTDNKDLVFVSGPQQSDDALANIGSLFIISANSRSEAQEFLEKEPLYRAGIFESIRITRFRRSGFFNPQLVS